MIDDADEDDNSKQTLGKSCEHCHLQLFRWELKSMLTKFGCFDFSKLCQDSDKLSWSIRYTCHSLSGEMSVLF